MRKTLQRTKMEETGSGRVLPLILFVWIAACVGLTACQLGTGDVSLVMDPEEIEYWDVTVEFRQYYQLTARDSATDAVVGGYPVEISMAWADGGCGGDVVSQYWVMEDESKEEVPCPWSTVTGDDGTVRFFVRFNGSQACGAWGYSISAFGEEGSYISSNAVNQCSDEE